MPERWRETQSLKNRIFFPDIIKAFFSFKNPVTRFCLVFAALLILFAMIMFQKSVDQHFIKPFTVLIASQAAWILNALGMKVAAKGITIIGEGFNVKILGNCNAVFEMGLFLCAVLAFPAKATEKAFAGLLGAIFIYCLNLLRVSALFLIGVYAPQHFDESHVYVSQTIFIVLVSFFWLIWIGKWIN